MVHMYFTEPVSPRYIHINPKTNKIHLMVPIVSGQEISTDNTCQANKVLNFFFDDGAFHELTAYKNALELDLALLDENEHPQQQILKEARLAQIVIYIEAVQAMRSCYADALKTLMTGPSNLYSIQLKPHDQDGQSRVVNPAFNINRGKNNKNVSLSPLYNAMRRIFSDTLVAGRDPRTTLTRAVLSNLSESPTIEDIQDTLKTKCSELFGLLIDFSQGSDGTSITKAAIDALMGFDGDANPKEYVDALLGACAADIWNSIPTPPFYSIPEDMSIEEKTECLSIITQFFLANLNVYCRAKGISSQNFGVILDASPALSQDLACIVSQALTYGDDIERVLCAFFNVHATEFELSYALDLDHLTAIRQKFERTYRTVTATKENTNMDDFMILDKEATGETAKFVTHQGSICVNFADLVEAASLPMSSDYFADIRTDFANHPIEIPHKNEWIALPSAPPTNSTQALLGTLGMFAVSDADLKMVPERANYSEDLFEMKR